MAPALDAESAASRAIRAADTGTGATPPALTSFLPVEAGFTPGPVFEVAAGWDAALPGGGGPAGGGVADGPSGMGGSMVVPEPVEPKALPLPPFPPLPESPPPLPPPPVDPAVWETGADAAGSID